jgi:tripartite-type tricarboxylate transporter receptor subunit TctC
MRACIAALASALVFFAAIPASAQDDVAAFFKGKQMRLIVGSAVGGGYDLYSRALARHMVNHIPGNPTMIVQNQPAAGGMILTNQLYNQGPKDGTVFSAPLNSMVTAPLLMNGAQFDATKLNWLGSLNREAYVAFLWHTAPVSHIADMATKEVLVGSTTVGTTMNDFPLLLNELLGYKFKLVRGYKGTPEINIAIERGEIQGNAGVGLASVKTLSQKWIDEKKIKFIAQFNAQPSPELPGVPLVMDQAKTEAQRRAMRLLFARTEFARPYFLPPDVPAERVRALRRAFDATMKDPAFLAEAQKLQIEILPMTGEALQKLVGELAATPPEIVARVKAALDAPVAK